MHTKIIKSLIALSISAFAMFAVLSACSKSSSNNSSNTTSTSVSIKGFAFSVSSLSIKTGTKVTWTNNDGVAHTVTADDSSFDSGNIAAGGTYSKTFTTAGTFAYHCNIHPMMTATIIVQ